MLNQSSPIPLYHQLAQLLRADIDRGLIEINEKIPSETELARKYAIGRPTVRQATDLLVRDGLLERRRGSGTYVLPPSRRIDLFSLAGTSAALKELPVSVEMTLISPLREITGPEHLPERLVGEPVYELRRLSCIDGEPILLEDIYLSAAVFPGLERIDSPQSSLANIAREHYFLEASSADQTFRIVHADAEHSRHLGVATGTPILGVARSVHFGQQHDAVYSDIFCLTDRYHFTQTLSAPTLQS
ncbi:MAG: GntR family transcriptional regulator [Pseudomonadota bacterium]